jgi:SAM-dependent methyltransferase
MRPEPLAYSNENHSLVVQALCGDLLARGVSLDIHADDEMLGFFLYSQGRELGQGVAMYLESGRRIWAMERQVLAWRFGPPPWPRRRILDFASGYGRVTRHIVTDVSPEEVWVSDIYAAGVAFQERCLGVHGVVSTTQPESFACAQTFDAILVSSLFTHLPEARFLGWLRRLGSLVAPGGLLLFSVHDLSIRREEAGGPAEGIVFEEVSESTSLEIQEYGTSWVGERFVRDAVETAIGPCPVLRIPRGLASFQDLYVVVKETGGGAGDPFSSLRIEREVDGFLEHSSLDEKRRLLLSGWLADRVTGQPPQEVRVRIDGRDVLSCRDFVPRPDVTPSFSADPTTAMGWRASVELPRTAGVESAQLGVHAVSAAGEEMLLYSGSLAAARLRSAQLDIVTLEHEMARRESESAGRQAELRERVEVLTRRVQEMEASRFWKARNRWFGFKRAVGLTPKT